jgi:HPt (histidine-containing phosphotransfer) domain-containing protein
MAANVHSPFQHRLYARGDLLRAARDRQARSNFVIGVRATVRHADVMSNSSDVANRIGAISPQARALFPKFLSNRAKDVVRIREALSRGEFAAIALLGHSMRGNGASYGLPHVSTIGTRIEAAADSKDATGVGACADELERYIKDVCAAENVHVD